MSGLTIPFTGLKRQYHNLRQEILDATDEVLRSGVLMNGNHTAEFENWLARKNRSKYAILVHSGTDALTCIAEYYATQNAIANPPTVLIPSLTYVATANAFMRAGWAVHFVDTDSHGLFDMRKVPEVAFQAVVLVGLYGAAVAHIGDVRTWRNWIMGECVIIEDAAQHWLAADCQRMGQAAAISFDPMKNLPCYGNGGAVVTNDSNLLQFARAWRNNGKDHSYLAGTNSRMSEIDCALMMVKTRHLDAWQERRTVIANYWVEKLRGAGIKALIDRDNIHDHSFHKFVIEIDARDEVMRKLETKKIETRVHYQQALHEYGIYRQWPGPDLLSCASALCRRVLSIPIYPELSDLEVEYVIDQVIDCV